MTSFTIGITGISGFIGSSAAEKLSSEGHSIVGLDIYTRHVNPVEQFPEDLDWVMHFGASTSINKSFDRPFQVYSNNLFSTLTAAQIAVESKCPMLFMSSYVYGKPEYLPIDEKHPVSALNPYMGSKIAGEEILRQISMFLGLPIIILRAFNIYGNWYSPGRLIPDLLHAVNAGEPLLVQDPIPRRDYLYIVDFIALLSKILTYSFSGVKIYNVGSGESYSNYEVARIVQSISDGNPCITVLDEPRKNDVIDCYADVDLIKKIFSWRPFYSLEQGLNELIHHKVK